MDISEDKVQQGIRRLLEAPKDLDRWDAGVGDPGRRKASVLHLELFERYRSEIGKVATDANAQWEKELQARQSTAGDRKAALQQMWTVYPAGPVGSDPALVGLIRRYWLECDAINRRLSSAERVAPEAFLLAWLVEAGERDALKTLAVMPYWPLGIDEQGNWV